MWNKMNSSRLSLSTQFMAHSFDIDGWISISLKLAQYSYSFIDIKLVCHKFGRETHPGSIHYSFLDAAIKNKANCKAYTELSNTLE